MPTTGPDGLFGVSWWWLIAAYWLVSIPVAAVLGRMLRYGSQEITDDLDQ